MIELLASNTNVLGERMATGLSQCMLVSASEPRPWPTDGYLVDDAANNLADDAGNQFIYTQLG